MIRLIQLLIFGHVHKWRTIAEAKIVRPEQVTDLGTLGRREGTRFVQECETCGIVAKRDLL